MRWSPRPARPLRSPVSAAAARPPTAAAPVPSDRATRGRAVREGREQGRGRPGRAAGDGAARAGGGRRQQLPVSGPKMPQPRDSGAPTLLPVRMRTHSSRFRDSTEIPPRAPARPRTRALAHSPAGPPTGALKPGEPLVRKARRSNWPQEKFNPPSPPAAHAPSRPPRL